MQVRCCPASRHYNGVMLRGGVLSEHAPHRCYARVSPVHTKRQGMMSAASRPTSGCDDNIRFEICQK